MSSLSTASLSLEIPSGTDGPPKEFRLFASGVNPTAKGNFVFNALSASSVLADAKRKGNAFPIDYEHASLFAAFSPNPSQAGKAAGWFKPEVREGALWASEVEWTKNAAEMLAAKEFRYYSPTFDVETKSGEVKALVNVALTNLPATYNLQPLMASLPAGVLTHPTEAATMKTLLAALGLSETASEAEAVAQLSRIQSPLMELLSVLGQKDAEAALGVAKAWKLQGEQLSVLSKELATLKAAQLEKERETLIADAKRAGKLPPAQEPFAKSLSLEQLRAYLSVLQPMAAPARPLETPSSEVALSAEDVAIASLAGVDPKAVAKRKAARMGVVPTVEKTDAPEDRA